jgi:hypothetical protein
MTRIALAIAACLAATAARAETRTIQAEKVASITIGGDVSANIDTDASLNGGIRLIGDALDCVSVTEGVDAQINTSGCGDSLGHLTVLLPRDLIVRLTHDSGETVSVGTIDGPVFEPCNLPFMAAATRPSGLRAARCPCGRMDRAAFI